MTREEAIKYGKNILIVANEENDADAIDFTKMAIAALEQEPCEDCISRAEAIKALEYNLSVEADGGFDKYRTVIKDLLNAIYNTQKKAIEDLPSVQPKGIYNKGWEDGAKAAAYHYELCIEEIKADIAEFMAKIPALGNCKEGWHNSGQRIGIEQACEIIDNHIAESEGKG